MATHLATAARRSAPLTAAPRWHPSPDGCRAQVPLDVAVCRHSDAGAPIVVTEPDSPCALAYFGMAQRLHAKLLALGREGPTTIVEE